MVVLEKEMNRARRNKKPFSIVMADLDHFKQVNDNYGHQAGDAVLREVAERMNLSLRSYDAVGRYGGEEFLLIFPECNKNDAMIIAEKVRLAINTKPITIPKEKLHVTASFGVTTINPAEENDISAIITIADRALYAAKANGRNRLEFADINDFS